MKSLFLLLLGLACTACAQHVEISNQNKTIAVSADASVTAEPEIAVLHLAYTNYGRTKEEAFKDDVNVANRVIAALQKAGVTKEQIESENLTLDRVEPVNGWSEIEKRERQFKARQAWKVRVPVLKAEQLVQIAVNAGANESGDPDWEVADHSALQAKAGAAALEKAKRIASEMAAGLGTRLGHLMYASNKAPSITDFLDAYAWGGGGGGSMAVEVTEGAREGNIPAPKLKIFPQKVKQDATVFAVFSIE